jgi:hypothetical protein
MALFHLDPVVEIYTWLGGAGTLGLIMLLTLTSVAVLVHFRRTPGRASLWKGAVAPTIAFLSLGFILILVVRNFELLIGPTWLAYLLLAVMVSRLARRPSLGRLAQGTQAGDVPRPRVIGPAEECLDGT